MKDITNEPNSVFFQGITAPFVKFRNQLQKYVTLCAGMQDEE